MDSVNSSRDSKKEEEQKVEQEDGNGINGNINDEVVVKVVDGQKDRKGQEGQEGQEGHQEDQKEVGKVEVKKLTDKEKMFCKEYLVDFNGTQSAIRAGYSEKTAKQIASENLSKPYLAEYLQQLIDNRAESCELSAKWVLDNLRLVAERCMQGEPILDREGMPTGAWRFNAMGANKSLELIGKHLGLFKEVGEKDEGSGFQLVILGDNPSKVDDK